MSEVGGMMNKVGGILFDGFKDDFHVVGLFVASDDDGLVKVIILPFSEDKTDIFSLVGRETVLINEDASVETIIFAGKNDGTVTFSVNLGVGGDGWEGVRSGGVDSVSLDSLEAEIGDGGFGVDFVEVEADFGIKLFKISIAGVATPPVELGDSGDFVWGESGDGSVGARWSAGGLTVGGLVGGDEFRGEVRDLFVGEEVGAIDVVMVDGELDELIEEVI